MDFTRIRTFASRTPHSPTLRTVTIHHPSARSLPVPSDGDLSRDGHNGQCTMPHPRSHPLNLPALSPPHRLRHRTPPPPCPLPLLLLMTNWRPSPVNTVGRRPVPGKTKSHQIKYQDHLLCYPSHDPACSRRPRQAIYVQLIAPLSLHPFALRPSPSFAPTRLPYSLTVRPSLALTDSGYSSHLVHLVLSSLSSSTSIFILSPDWRREKEEGVP
ncbi:hypothetical protein CALCODRAFT_85247 [Calocera cornea HHB12733]|uniref:Uncharacterized protein n=1 Tax=Calocera cornea HHB12733 TaxID=1353952 RepID=A0A165ING4_9BASI|nr:hypothetical protein CALCODRAFT_85247 [Calocera cornea HHB12733]